MSARYCILIADDDEDTRAILSARLYHEGYDVITAARGDTALALAAEHEPEVALIDVRMPGPSGTNLASRLSEINPATETIVITAYGSIESAVQAMSCGVFTYLPKPLEMDKVLVEVSKAAHAAHASRSVCSSRECDPARKADLMASLTEREQEVLDGLIQGMTDHEIATALEISVHTVSKHLHHILVKLDLQNRTQAALLWDRLQRKNRERPARVQE